MSMMRIMKLLVLGVALTGAGEAMAAKRFDYRFTAKLTNGDALRGSGQFVTGREVTDGGDTLLEITEATGSAIYGDAPFEQTVQVTGIDQTFSLTPSSIRESAGAYSLNQLDLSFDGPPGFIYLLDGRSGFSSDFVGVEAEFTLIALGAAGVPEPASWAMMIGGFGLAGVALRRRQRVRVAFA